MRLKIVSSKIWFFYKALSFGLQERKSSMKRKRFYFTSGIAATAIALVVAGRVFQRSRMIAHAN